ncbi:LuxR C-terminal-related transcriptional regulator [Streptomyces sp. NPDC058755]|uniref:helix-turn-helix transcriptional regulator n=1 Tax=Streptomyces sp. NPDC058755 TaxID=3346624 RepID=UPI0036B97AE1
MIASDDALLLYAHAANQVEFDPDQVHIELGITAERAKSAVRELVSLQLVQPCVHCKTSLTCVDPERAAARALAPLERQAHEQRVAIDEMRAGFKELSDWYVNCATTGRGSRSIELITDLTTVLEVISQLADKATTQVLTAQPGGARPEESLAEAMYRDEALIRRGVSLRTLYQHSARYSQPTAAYVERLTALGAEVRIVPGELTRMIIFDDHCGLLEIQDNSSAALIVGDRHVVQFMTQVFERTWLAAEPFARPAPDGTAKGAIEGVRATIMSLLAAGLDDRSIAKRLGISQRTCQRHVAEVMTILGATSRFQAGYLYREAQSRQPALDNKALPPTT